MPYDRIPGRTMPSSDDPDRGVWAGFKPDTREIEGVVTDVNVGGSDPTLQVRGPDGRNWTVELAGRSGNARAGLTRTSILPGEAIRVTGRRTARFGERRIKALSLRTADAAFDLYPDPACA